MTDLKSLTRNAMDVVGDANPAKPGSPLSGAKGAAAGVALAILPIAVEKIVQRVGDSASGGVSDLGDRAAEKAKEATKKTADKVSPGGLKGGAAGMVGKGLAGKIFSGNGGGPESGGDSNGKAAPGYGSGRRMPIQQSVDVAVPVKTAYNQWTRFEDWPRFMHRVESVDQADDATVAFSTKVWGMNKRFEANIVEQRPDERIEWDVSEGLAHTGVVTFHPLSRRLTRIEVTVDIHPDSLLEKAGRGMRHAKRAIRGDLHRFKAYVELYEDEVEKGWRGTISDGDVKRRTERKPTNASRRRASPSKATRSRSGGRSRKAPARS